MAELDALGSLLERAREDAFYNLFRYTHDSTGCSGVQANCPSRQWRRSDALNVSAEPNAPAVRSAAVGGSVENHCAGEVAGMRQD